MKTVFSVIVKGTLQEAHEHARQRGVALITPRENRHGETVALIESDFATLGKWFAEDSREWRCGPFSVGSLLWYGEHDATAESEVTQ
jgi:hypothetical protein